MKWISQELGNSLHRPSTISGRTTTTCNSILYLVLSVVLSFGLFINLPGEVNATSAFYETATFTAEGYFNYIGGDTAYQPVYNFDDGRTHVISLSREAERSFGLHSTLVNLSQDTINGYLNDGYQIRFNFAGNVEVYQPYSTNTGERYAWYEYEFSPERIDSRMLARPTSESILIYAVIIILLSVTITGIIKAVRHD